MIVESRSPPIVMQLVQHRDHVPGELNQAFILAAVAVIVAAQKLRARDADEVKEKGNSELIS